MAVEAREHTGELIVHRLYGDAVHSWNGDTADREAAAYYFHMYAGNCVRGEVEYEYRNDDGTTRTVTRSSSRWRASDVEKAVFDPDATRIEMRMPSHG